MKAEKKRIGIFSRIWAAATKNWGLKLLALILAIIVYHSLKPQVGSSRKSDDRNIFQNR